jgi:hypothetical protein
MKQSDAIIVLIIGFAFGYIIYYYREIELSSVLIVILVGFLVYDFVSESLIKGGKGFLIIPFLNRKGQPKWFGFIFFLLSIFGTTVVVDRISQSFVTMISNNLQNLWQDVVLGVVLAFLIFYHMDKKFYCHTK